MDARSPVRRATLVVTVLLLARPGSAADRWPSPLDAVTIARAQSGGEGGGSGPGTGGSNEGGAAELPAPLDRAVEAVNPGRLHRRRDERRGRETERSDKPRAPEVPLAVFFESIRPLGGLKYENQLNYLVAAFTGDAPTFQTITYEYVFADWHAARFEAVFPEGRLGAVALGYQRTFGVGPRGNWVHGGLVLPEVG